MKFPRLTKLNSMILICLILWTAFIWNNSIPKQEVSNEQSQYVTEIVEPVLEAVQVPTQSHHHFVRKSAHLIEFSVLGILWAVLFRGRHLQWPLLGCLLTAMADEGIQALTGRGNQWSDVGLDFFGSAAAILAVSVVFFLWNRLKKSWSNR